jgi:hypothetical protein
MVRTSTLFYLLDDLNKPSDMLLETDQIISLKDEHYCSLLDLLEVDPGEKLVSLILEKLEEK